MVSVNFGIPCTSEAFGICRFLVSLSLLHLTYVKMPYMALGNGTKMLICGDYHWQGWAMNGPCDVIEILLFIVLDNLAKSDQ